MIVMVQQGRLGNQVFQYLALRSVAAPGERVLLLGFSSLRSVFDGLEAQFVPIENSPLRHVQSLNYSRWGPRLRACPGLGTITESETGEPVRSPRSTLDVAEPSWFQTSSLLNSPALIRLHVRSHHLAAAQAAMQRAGVPVDRAAFVHVRAGDYRTWPSEDFPAILAPGWYRDRMADIRDTAPDTVFVAVGDEPEYVDAVIAGVEGVVTLRGTEEVEFAAMSLCRAGVLSASSFAYWGAFLAHREHPKGHFLAPRNWAGHSRGEWYPAALRGDFLTYVE